MGKPVIIVCSALGRVGSSALMGLLALSGCNVGGRHTGFRRGGLGNPKGVYEIEGEHDLFNTIFPKYYKQFCAAPTSVNEIERITNRHIKLFDSYIAREFGDSFPIAIKAMRLLKLSYFAIRSKRYDSKIIWIERALQERINSSLFMMQRLDPQAIQNKQFEIRVRNMCLDWNKFGNQIKRQYPDIPQLTIKHADMMHNPQATIERVAAFAGLITPPPQKVIAWIDKTLVNRYTKRT